MIARYNIYFNATQNLEKATTNLAKKHKDDFEEILPIYPYGTKKDGKSMRSTLDEVMKKASKVIQNKPKSKWADDAYFVIGQTHFFGGDHFAAIEVFQFVNTSYNDEDIKALSQLWLMKSYIALEKYNDAEAILGLLQENKSTDNRFLTHLNLSAGDLLVKQEKYSEAITYLQKGLSRLKDKELKYRTNFVLGQLNLLDGNYEKANSNFIKVLKLNAPYEYVFQANLGMARSTAQSGGKGARNTKKYLKRMLDDDKNIEYFNQIYYELAKLELAIGDKATGLDYMHKSAQNASNNNTQSTKTYLFLADYYFKERSYDKAQAYYDTTVSVLSDKFPDAAKIRSQHAVLSKLIENIETIRTQDSLLKLSAMDRDKLDRFITKLIEEEKEKERIAKEELRIRQEQERLNPGSGLPTPSGGSSGGVWYFYNPTAVSRGSNDFIRVWGSRKNSDWWRFINKSVVEAAAPEKEETTDEEDPDDYNENEDEEQNEVLENLDEEKLAYYKPIPFSAMSKLVAEKKIQDAFHGIGKIYFNDLKEYKKSVTNFNTLLNRYPTTKHKPEVLYYLSRCFTELGNDTEASKYAKQIADEHPETPYNKVLNAKEIVEDESDREVVELYAKMYDAFNNGKYNKVTSIKQQIDKDYPGSSIQAKIDYLYALTIGKTKGKDAYIKELEAVKEAYQGTEIGEMADFTLRLLKNDGNAEEAAASIYDTAPKSIHYYVITGTAENEKNVKIELDKYHEQYFGTKKFQINSLVFGDKNLFYIKQFVDKAEVLKYHTEMEGNTTFLTNVGLRSIESYAISEANFQTLVKSNKEKEYLRFFWKNYN